MNALATLLAAVLLQVSPPADTLRLMFWNLENCFDWIDSGTGSSDTEFSSRGERHWTRKRFKTKLNAISKGILWAASEEGGLPDAIGLAEVENRHVLERLLEETPLRKTGYKILHSDSPDPRGIDVALLYRPSKLRLKTAKACHLYDGDSLLRTRDILLATFEGADGTALALAVNHHPSKYGGISESEPRRRIAVERLRFLADSLRAEGIENLVALGDFNDTPANPVYKLLEPALNNWAEPLFQKGLGTIKYDGQWELIDMLFASETLKGQMKILQIPFLMTRDTGHAGLKPLRTYSGPRYLGGVSDHCPIWGTVVWPTR